MPPCVQAQFRKGAVIKMRIETDRLVIRNFVIEDKDDMCEYMAQRIDAKFEGYPGFTYEFGAEEVARRSAGNEFFAIELKNIGKVIGNVYMGIRDFNSRELGYVLNEKYFAQGYGTEACAAVLDYFFKRGIHRIYAETAPENTASWRLMEKLGMKREAHLRKNVSFHNDENGRPIYWDTYVYGILNPNE